MPTPAYRAPASGSPRPPAPVPPDDQEEDDSQDSATAAPVGIDLPPPVAPIPAATRTRPYERPVYDAGPRLADDPAIRRQQSIDKMNAEFAAKQQRENPFLFSGAVKSLSKVGGRRYEERAVQQGDEAYQQQVMQDRQAAVQARRDEVEAQKAVNAGREAKLRGTGQKFYTDPYGNIQPVLDPTGRPLYSPTPWVASKHPKSGAPVKEMRDQYGQRQFKEYPLTTTDDPRDMTMHWNVDGELVPAMSIDEAIKKGGIIGKKARTAQLQKLRGQKEQEVAQSFQERAAVDLEAETAASNAEAMLQRSAQVAATNPAEAQKLAAEAAAIQDSLDPRSGDLAFRKKLAAAKHNVSVARANRDGYELNQQAIADRLMEKGIDPETDPIYKANKEGYAKFQSGLATAEAALANIEGLRSKPGVFETELPPSDEEKFRQWKQVFAPNDSGDDYDFRGAFKERIAPDSSGHWPDTYKKPNHPTFSDESIYAKMAPDKAGHWENGVYIPPGARGGAIKQVVKSVARGATAEGIYAAGEGGSRLFAQSPIRRGMESLEDWATEKIQGFPLTEAQKATRQKLRQRAAEKTGSATVDRFANEYATATAKLREDIRRALPVDQKFAESKLGQIAQGVGQLAAAVPVALATGGAGVAGLSISQIYDEGYQDAIQSGATPAQAHSAAMKYLPAAAVDTLADRLVIGKLLKPLAGKMTVGQFVKDVLTTAAVEGGTEGSQQFYLNNVAKTLEGYDPNRPLDKEVIDSIIVGAAVGGGATALGTGTRMAAGEGRTPPNPPKPTGPADTVEPVPPAGPADTLPAQEPGVAANAGDRSELDIAQERFKQGLTPEQRAEMDRILAEGTVATPEAAPAVEPTPTPNEPTPASTAPEPAVATPEVPTGEPPPAEADVSAGETPAEAVEATVFRGVPKRGNTAGAGPHRFYSESKEEAGKYASGVGEVVTERIRFERPFISENWITAKKALGLPASASMDEVINEARRLGHDGVVWSHHGKREYVKIGNDTETPEGRPPVTTDPEAVAAEPILADQPVRIEVRRKNGQVVEVEMSARKAAERVEKHKNNLASIIKCLERRV